MVPAGSITKAPKWPAWHSGGRLAILSGIVTEMGRDLRVCFLGDSFVAGIGDPEHSGWVGRVAARTHGAGHALTAYNLGVRRQTSVDVLARARDECAPRLPDACDGRVVISVGTNDTTWEGSGPRVPPDASAAALIELLAITAAAGWPTLVVGPPPVADQEQDQRIAALDGIFARVSRDAGVSYVPVLASLSASPVWLREAQDGDGAHPGAAGYAELAALVWPAWVGWLAEGPRDD